MTITETERVILMNQAVIMTGIATLLEGKTVEQNELAQKMHDLARDLNKELK